jgi:hypothetical protein
MRTTILAAAIVAAAVAAGCTPAYVYVPLTIGAPAGPVVRYAVPPEYPRGDVYVTSFGFTELDSGAGHPVNALHARLAIANKGTNAWALDGREQQLVAQGQPPQGPSFLNSDAGPGPLYLIPAGTTRVLDLYYVLAPPLDSTQGLGTFSLSWRLLVGAEPVSQTTAFARVEEQAEPYAPYPPFVAVGLGVGVGWWYGPRYAAFGPPVIRGYYYPPARAHASGGWRSTPPGSAAGGWRSTAPGTRAAHAGPARGGGHR